MDGTEYKVQCIWAAANQPQLTDVRDACCVLLRSQLHRNNWPGIRTLTDMHNYFGLPTSTKYYIERHSTGVWNGNEYYSLLPEQLSQLITSDTATVLSMVGFKPPYSNVIDTPGIRHKSTVCMEDSWNRFKRLPQGYGLSGDVFIMRTDKILAVAPLATDSMDL